MQEVRTDLTGCDQLEKSCSDGGESRSCWGRTGPERTGPERNGAEIGGVRSRISSTTNTASARGARQSASAEPAAPQPVASGFALADWQSTQRRAARCPRVEKAVLAGGAPSKCTLSNWPIGGRFAAITSTLHAFCLIFECFSGRAPGYWFRSVRKRYSKTSNRAPREFATFGRSFLTHNASVMK